MTNEWKFGIIAAILALGVFFGSIHFFHGYLRSESGLGGELKSPPDSLYQYNLADEAPFRYRLLFPVIVKSSYDVVSDGENTHTFFATFRFWSALFYVTSVVALFVLLRTLNFSVSLSFAGCVIFLVLPPMMMAFSLPVHTREDTLAYTILFLALVFLARNQLLYFIIFSTIGALTRETLLILPLLYFFFVADKNIVRKLLITGVPGAVWLVSRMIAGHEDYDVWLGLRWNLSNPEQVIGFSFLAFGFCWLPFLHHVLTYKKQLRSAPADLLFYYRTSLFTLVIIFLTTFLGGIFNEIRLLNLLFPWMIVIVLDFLRTNSAVIRSVVRKNAYLIFAVVMAIGAGAALVFALPLAENVIEKGKWAVRYDNWIIVTVFHIFIVVLFLPPWLQVVAAKKPIK